MFAAPGRRDLRRSQSNEAVPGNDDLLFQRPWSLPAFDPCPDFPMRPRFDSNRSAAELQKLRPEDLLQLAGNKPARRRAVQPPILFGFD
jgi:hypothetical protein